MQISSAVLILVATLATVLVVGGSRGAAGGGSADVRGHITAVHAASSDTRGVAGSVLVEGPKTDDVAYDRASVTIADDTKVLGPDGSSLRFEDLRVGMRVEVRFVGPVAESYPVQARAATVRVLDEAKPE